ncbi:MAG TPA: UDP-N-acetyl-D-glucosamine dehydrogenase [Anaerolineaceae bacterium]|uniref:UDP-glucose/GDP-mannose dehydrogenase n=1 Tax=Anaerolinea thermophila TaxID=167964 RepID=A0A101FY06_9CHLR|nr:MAG: UDP-glucose/GDP-mannose dehydrogenase [Anaerolinea thermophila]HAF61114.1 UDP-N-acetyl-D-glucosamine dehydrogenase [Anaerolineaceae bacterium]
MNHAKELITKFEDKSAHIGVLGLGYVGLPLAVVFAQAGFEVTGIDPVEEKVKSLGQGKSYVLDVPDETIKMLTASGKLKATTDFSVLKDLDAVSICVPTPLRKTGDPDLSFIISVTDSLKQYVHPGMAVVLESTTYPGTTRELLKTKLTEGNELKVGEDLFLAFSPERVDPGRIDFTTINTPKVIGGITPACLEVTTSWYGQALEKVVPVSSAEVAEMAKLLENTFRMINIGLVNEMAIMCDRLGVDIWEVIDAASTKPFGFMKFQPGPGLGGHCIPIDPLYLSWKLKTLNYSTRFINLASEINTGMPRFTVTKIQDALNTQKKPINGSKILVLGVAYKPDIDDLRESPALDIIHLLQEKGAQVQYHDPFIPAIHHDELRMQSVADFDKAVKEADCVVIVTNHSLYDYADILKNARLIFDARNALGDLGKNNPKVVKL